MNKFTEWANSKILPRLDEYKYGEWFPYKSNNGNYVRRAFENSYPGAAPGEVAVVYSKYKGSDVYCWGYLNVNNTEPTEHFGDDWCLNMEDKA